MSFRTEAAFLAVLLVTVAAPARVNGTEITDRFQNNEIKDGAAQQAISEMLCKLGDVLEQQSCHSDKARPCIDIMSSTSVLSQLCDRITALEAKLNRLASCSKPETQPPANHNSSDQADDIKNLKLEIVNLKRSSAFYASRTDNMRNVTHEKIVNYNATVNNGVNFDPISGVYQAPHEGIYHFALTYQKNPEVNLKAFLLVDNVIMASAQDNLQAHVDLLTSLKRGQEVWTDLTTNSIPLELEVTEVTFTFSGYLIN